ncbi:intercellular adhesion molecule 3-like isoform X1 [Hemiscyllium ocellatum]|uniref:intercellular adhesion molecule 3-like isoform X1 n=1 Tax=Hemiscyllium ocellatum TaxID=170820 RepID=UPI002966653F|nr:intercellular adhesion molecule 3-like isoform X1 [Hemiscyllium ocellatum]
MDFQLSPRFAGGYLFFLAFTGTVGKVTGLELQVNANPPAVAFGDPLVVNCSTSCAGSHITIEGLRNYPKLESDQWVSVNITNIHRWSFSIVCFVQCKNMTVTKRKDITVYNREINITVLPEVLEINRTYRLECIGPRVYPNNKLILTWLRGSEILQRNSTGERGSVDEDKRLRNVFNFVASRSDDGQEYTCLAEVDLGSNTTKLITNSSVTLQAYYKPIITALLANNKSVSKSPVYFSKGESIILQCDYQGNPRPTLKWEWPKQSNVVINPSGALSISDATTKNTGTYKCSVMNQLGAEEKIVDINIKGKAMIIAAASVSVVATLTLATGVIIYYLNKNVKKTGVYKLQNAKPNNNPQVPNENQHQE